MSRQSLPPSSSTTNGNEMNEREESLPLGTRRRPSVSSQQVLDDEGNSSVGFPTAVSVTTGSSDAPISHVDPAFANHHNHELESVEVSLAHQTQQQWSTTEASLSWHPGTGPDANEPESNGTANPPPRIWHQQRNERLGRVTRNRITRTPPTGYEKRTPACKECLKQRKGPCWQSLNDPHGACYRCRRKPGLANFCAQSIQNSKPLDEQKKRLEALLEISSDPSVRKLLGAVLEVMNDTKPTNHPLESTIHSSQFGNLSLSSANSNLLQRTPVVSSTLSMGNMSNFIGNRFSGAPTFPQFPQFAPQFTQSFLPHWPAQVSQNPFIGPNTFNPANAPSNADPNLMDIEPQATFEMNDPQNLIAMQPNPPHVDAVMGGTQLNGGSPNVTNSSLIRATLVSIYPHLRSDPIRLQSLVSDTELYLQTRLSQQSMEPVFNLTENPQLMVSSPNLGNDSVPCSQPPSRKDSLAQQESQSITTPSLGNRSPPCHFDEAFSQGLQASDFDDSESLMKFFMSSDDKTGFPATIPSSPSSPEVIVKE